MGQNDIAARGVFSFRRKNPLRSLQKGVDTFNAGHGRLNGLNFHTKAFDRSKNTGNIIDYGNRCPDRHAEQSQYLCLAGGGKQHNNADNGRVQQKHHRRINSVIKVCFFNGSVAFTDAPIVAVLHVAFQAESADGAQIMQRFRHLSGNGSNGAPVFQLCGKHFLLHMTCKDRKKRKNHN